MKKLLAIVLAAACAVSLASCSAPVQTVSCYAQEPSTAQLAVPEPVSMPQYPDEEAYLSGKLDSGTYDALWNTWWEARQARTANMTAPGTLDSYFTRIIRALMQGMGEDNRVCSPLNVYMALAMLAACTDGESRQQLLSLLGTDSLAQLQKQTAQLWTENSWADGLVTSRLANSIWLRDGYSYQQDTLDTLADSFYASAFSGEMGSDAYNQELQDWINSNTGSLLAEQAGELKLSPQTVLALISTIYYSAQWTDRFYDSANTQGTFHAPSGDKTATFMHSSQNGTLYSGDGFTAISLPLRGSGSMWLLKPDSGVTAESLLQSDEALAFLLSDGSWSQTQNAQIDLSIPKFDIASDLDLTKALQSLGVTDIFDLSISNFTPLSTADPLYVSKARHAARVKIDEEGCEAAAYTVISVEAGAALPEAVVPFTLDAPFVFAVTGVDGLPLFVGLVNQPE